MDPYVDLARRTIEEYLTNNCLPDSKECDPKLFSKKAACFVTLHEKESDKLRGCIGTIVPQYRTLAGEIIANAIEAATRDPRFPAVTLQELKKLKLSIDILSEPEPIKSKDLLDPKKFGIIVKSLNDGRTGLLLPDIEGVNSVDEQIQIAKEKAGIFSTDNEISLYRFSVERHQES